MLAASSQVSIFLCFWLVRICYILARTSSPCFGIKIPFSAPGDLNSFPDLPALTLNSQVPTSQLSILFPDWPFCIPSSLDPLICWVVVCVDMWGQWSGCVDGGSLARHWFACKPRVCACVCLWCLGGPWRGIGLSVNPWGGVCVGYSHVQGMHSAHQITGNKYLGIQMCQQGIWSCDLSYMGLWMRRRDCQKGYRNKAAGNRSSKFSIH